jgi:hypothetical protein
VTAKQLLQHAKQYDPVVSGAAEQESMKARRFQRQEREKAATLMREAAEDYTKQHDLPKARAVYQSVIEQYPEDEYRHIRTAAETSLRRLETE